MKTRIMCRAAIIKQENEMRTIKTISLLICIGVFVQIMFASCEKPAYAAGTMSDEMANKMADAIFKVENSKSHPYGIMIKTSDPRRVCINTIKNNYVRWQNAGSPGEYVDYLADKYCPKSSDPVGNKNWKKNIRKFLK